MQKDQIIVSTSLPVSWNNTGSVLTGCALLHPKRHEQSQDDVGFNNHKNELVNQPTNPLTQLTKIKRYS